MYITLNFLLLQAQLSNTCNLAMKFIGEAMERCKQKRTVLTLKTNKEFLKRLSQYVVMVFP